MRINVLSCHGSSGLLSFLFYFSAPCLLLRRFRTGIRFLLLSIFLLATLPVSAQPLAAAAQPTVDANSINASDQVGATLGTFTVDKTGAAKYSIPIYAVPGTAGVTPKLSLDYDSTGGNGLFGLGWSMGGLSEITRCHQNKLQDGQSKPITWSADDRFCMDGQRLIPVWYGVVYKKEIDDGTVVIAYYPSNGSSPDYFRARHKDGSYSFYGNAPTSRDPDSTTLVDSNTTVAAANGKMFANYDPSKVVTWRLRKYQDMTGNPIWYKYGWYLGFSITEIRYAYGANTGPDSYGARIYLSFQGSRPDVMDTGYIGGLSMLGNSLRASQIISESGGTAIRTYNLSYIEPPGNASTYTGPSHLSSVQECGLNNICRPATQFTWQLPQVGVSPQQITITNHSNGVPAAYGDINGDGCADAIFAPGTLVYELGNCQNGSYALSADMQFAGSNLIHSNEYFDTASVSVVDFNNDGHADVAVFDNNTTKERWLYIYYSEPQPDGSWKLSSSPVKYDMASKATSSSQANVITTPFFADINGDGNTDIIFGSLNGTQYSGIGVMYGQLDATPSHLLSRPYIFGNKSIIGDGCSAGGLVGGNYVNVAPAGDFNGDGQVDLFIGVYNSSSQNIAGIETPQGTTSTSLGCWSAGNNGWHVVDGLLGTGVDINADGYTDLGLMTDGIGFVTILMQSTQLNTGTSLLAAKKTYPDSAQNQAFDGTSALADFNGDGYLDEVVSYGANFLVRLWSPGLSSFLTTSSGSGGFSSTRLPGSQDLNGDGVPDVVFTDIQNQTIVVQMGLDINRARNVITQITDGVGAVTKINYENTTNSTHYQKLSFNGAPPAPPAGTQACTPATSYPCTFQWTGQSYINSSSDNYYTAMNAGFDIGLFYEEWLGKQEAPISELSGPKWVVTAVDQSMPSTTSASLGAVSTGATHRTSYYYGEGKIENSIRGFLGFQTIKVVDEGSGLQTITHYRQDFPFIGKPFLIDVYTSTNQLVSTTYEWWGFQDWCDTCGLNAQSLAKPYLVTPEPKYIVVNRYDPDATGNPLLGNTWTHNIFDGNLNKASSQVDTNDAGGNTLATVLTTYTYFPSDPNDARNYLGLPTQITVQSTRDQTMLTHTYGFTYCGFDTSSCPAYASGLIYQKIAKPNINNSALNITTQYSYDTLGPNGGTLGNRTQEKVSGVDIVDRSTSWAYDLVGRFVTTTTNGLGQVVSNVFSRNALGQPTQINGLNGTSVQYGYGPLGRQYLEYHNDGSYMITLRYNNFASCPAGTVIADVSNYSGGSSSGVCYDVIGRPTQTFKNEFTSGIYSLVNTEYDSAGRVHNVTEPYDSNASAGGYSTTTYDVVGRVSRRYSAERSPSVITYNGLSTTVADFGHSTTTAKNLMGEITKVTDTLGGTVEYTYDPESHPLTVKTSGSTQATGVPASITVTYAYDDAGRQKTMSDPDKGTWSYTYDVLGELLTQTDAKGQVISIPAATSSSVSQGYDALGRVLTRTDKKINGTIEETTTWTYDSAPNGVGEIASVQQTNSHYLRTYNYDSLGRENGQSISLTAEGVQYNIARYYDQYGREYQTFDASGNGIQRYYNPQGFFYKANDLSSNFTVGSQLYTVLSMDAGYRVTGDGLGLASNGTSPLITRTSTYDVMGRPTSIQSTSGVTLQNLNYSYYGVSSNQYGNMAQRQDATKNLTETFNYDGLNRLTSSQVTNQSAVTISYDSFGNIISKSDRGAYSYATSAGPHAVTSVAGVANTYDANGNYSGTGSTRTVTYNTFDKPTSIFVGGAPVSAFTYGPDRDYYKRLEFSGGTTTETLYLDGVERVYNLSAGTRMDRRYLPGGAYRINNYTGVTSYNVTTNPGTLQSTTVEYLLDDHQGSTDVIADANGNVKQAMSFDAWGMRRNPSTWVALTTAAGFDNSQTSHGYTGHEMVDNANIIHMHGRIYDPRWGRMLQADPYIQDPTDTQAQNRFTYVLNNPLIHTDPTGYCTDFTKPDCFGHSGTANGLGGMSLGNSELDGVNVYGFNSGFINSNGSSSNSGKSAGGTTNDLKKPASVWTLLNWIKSATGNTQTPIVNASVVVDNNRVTGIFDGDNHTQLTDGFVASGVMVTCCGAPSMGPQPYDLNGGGIGIEPVRPENALIGPDVLAAGLTAKLVTPAFKAIAPLFIRPATQAAGEGFSSFRALKRALGSPGEGNQWHHIVEQSQVGKFGAEAIHSADNVVAIPEDLHRKISGFYSSKQPFTNGETVRQWLGGQSFEEQYQFGRDILERFGGGN